MQEHNEQLAFRYGLAAVLLWSTVATGFKLGLTLLSVSQLVMLGTGFSWLVFGLAVIARRPAWPAGRELGLAAVLGMINPLTYYLVLFAAYDRLPAYIAQPVNYTWAITLALLAIPILKQRIAPVGWFGILLSYAGVVVLLTWGSTMPEQTWSASGVALALASTVLWALYWLLSTRASADPTAMMFASFTFALPGVVLVCLLTDGVPELSAETLFYGAWVGLIEMGITFLLWQAALKRTRQAGRIGQLIFLSPFLSLGLIYVVLEEPIGPGAFVGLAVIVGGLFLTQRAAPNPSSAP